MTWMLRVCSCMFHPSKNTEDWSFLGSHWTCPQSTPTASSLPILAAGRDSGQSRGRWGPGRNIKGSSSQEFGWPVFWRMGDEILPRCGYPIDRYTVCLQNFCSFFCFFSGSFFAKSVGWLHVSSNLKGLISYMMSSWRVCWVVSMNCTEKKAARPRNNWKNCCLKWHRNMCF